MSLTVEAHPRTITIADVEAQPLTAAEGNALIALSAGQERTPKVHAGTRNETRAWRQRGQVD